MASNEVSVLLMDDWITSHSAIDNMLGIIQSASTNTIAANDTNYMGQLGQYGYYWPLNAVFYGPPSRPIKLTLTEVEQLKRAAKSDEKLKAILSKFTSQIEVIVAF